MESSDEVVAAVTWRMKYKVMASRTATIMCVWNNESKKMASDKIRCFQYSGCQISGGLFYRCLNARLNINKEFLMTNNWY